MAHAVAAELSETVGHAQAHDSDETDVHPSVKLDAVEVDFGDLRSVYERGWPQGEY